MNSVLSKVARVMLASAFVISGLTSFADLGASQLDYAAGGLKTIGITDPSVAAACFWIAKTLEALGGLLLAGAPLLSLLGVSSERAAEKLGAAMLLVFIAAVTPCLHPPSGDVQQFLKMVMLFGGLLYVVANDAPKASSDSKKGK